MIVVKKHLPQSGGCYHYFPLFNNKTQQLHHYPDFLQQVTFAFSSLYRDDSYIGCVFLFLGTKQKFSRYETLFSLGGNKSFIGEKLLFLPYEKLSSMIPYLRRHVSFEDRYTIFNPCKSACSASSVFHSFYSFLTIIEGNNKFKIAKVKNLFIFVPGTTK